MADLDDQPRAKPTDWRGAAAPASLACFILTAAIGLSADLWTKHEAFARLAATRFEPASVYQMIPGYLHFEVTENRGAVFGIGQGQRLLFVIVSAVAVGFLGFLFARSGRRHGYQILLGMLLAGVLGNLYDRAMLGYVRDMIHALPAWGVFPWIFNVADSLLCVGVFFLLIYSFFEPEKDRLADPVEAAHPSAGEAEGRGV